MIGKAWPWTTGLLLCASVCSAQNAQPDDNYDELFAAYLSTARRIAVADTAASSRWMADLFTDPKARALNDLVTVHVVENVSGGGRADSNVAKKSGVSAGLDALGYNPGEVSTAFGTTFQGGGSTARAGELSAVVTARVAEVLPNGDLIVEGVREIEINGDRQIIVLTGVVRPADIGPTNVVPSTAIGQMRIRYFGRGVIKDHLQPGWLIRFLSRIF